MSALVQHAGNFNNLGVSQVTSFGSNVTAGNCAVVVALSNSAAASVTGVSDAVGNTYTKLAASNVHAGCEIWAAFNVTGGFKDVTVSWSGSGNPGIGVALLEVSGGLIAKNKSTTGSGTGTNPSDGSISPTTPDFVVAGIAYSIGLTGAAAGSGWTVSNANAGGGAEYQILGTGGGSVTGTFSNANSGNWDMVVVSLTDTTPPPPTTPNYVQVQWC